MMNGIGGDPFLLYCARADGSAKPESDHSVHFDTNSIDNGSYDGGFGLYSSTLTKERVRQFLLRLKL